jgi:hypothetical protein
VTDNFFVIFVSTVGINKKFLLIGKLPKHTLENLFIASRVNEKSSASIFYWELAPLLHILSMAYVQKVKNNG